MTSRPSLPAPWIQALALVALCLLCYLPGLFSTPPIDRDEARFCVNALIVGRTVRQLGNRLTEPPEDALASLLSLGFDLNTCTQNQGSHCILPRSPAQLVDRYNLVEFPSDLCPRG